MSRPRQALARHPIAWFLAIGIGANLAAALTALPGRIEVTQFDLPVDGMVGGFLGVGLAAFVVTAAADGSAGVDDLVRRCLRWRVPVRWYLVALLGVPVTTMLVSVAIYGSDGVPSPSVLPPVLALFFLQLILFQSTEEIGWTGFFQDRLRGRYGR